MAVPVDVWLRGNDYATTDLISVTREPNVWTDDDVRLVLEGMLQAMHRARHPSDPVVGSIALRGLSWIVNPFEDGGVVIAIEITMGAAVAGPFDIEKAALDAMIARVLQRPVAPFSPAVH